MHLAQILKSQFKDKDKAKGPWNTSRTAGNYKPAPGGRATVKLSATATRIILGYHRGRNNAVPGYVLLTPEGQVRHGAIELFQTWALAVKIALEEGVYIYNTRTKKTSRPIWLVENLNERTFNNMLFEPVHCVPHEKTFAQMLPRKTARVFATEV